MSSDPFAWRCPVCLAGPGERCRAVTVGHDPMRSLIHRARALEAHRDEEDPDD